MSVASGLLWVLRELAGDALFGYINERIFHWLGIAELSVIAAVVSSVFPVALLTVVLAAVYYLGRASMQVSPRRDCWVLDAIYYLAFGSWNRQERDGRQLPPRGHINAIFNAGKAMQQAALDGGVVVWGKEDRTAMHEAIPREYWGYYGFGDIEILRRSSRQNFREEFQTKYARAIGRGRMGPRSSLMTNRAQVKALRKKQVGADRRATIKRAISQLLT